MASNSHRSIYKSKIREETTALSRRKSRCLERKKCREDEVNKRRLLSDDMSPVVEDNTYFDDEEEEDIKKPVVHKKAASRLELLQQWREEKKRKLMKAKEDKKKPMFKVSPVKHKGESYLYLKAETNEIKTDKKNTFSFQAKLAAVSNDKKNTFVNSVKSKTAPSHVGTSAPSGATSNTRQTRAAKSAEPQATKAQSTKYPSTRSTRQTAATKTSVVVNPAKAQPVQQRGKISDLSSKMTASAAAKAKNNLDKPREFLRAKARPTRATVNSKKGTDLVPKLEQGDMGDTQLPIIEYAQPSFQEVRIASAVAKRRSVKIAGLPSTSDASCDDESTEGTKYPRTPRFSRRKSTRTSIAHPESHVSVSDEGTSDVTGTDLVPKLDQGDMGDTQLPIIECAQPSFQEVRIASAVAKRRSVLFAGLPSTSDASCDDESTESTKYPRTPRFSRRKSTRTSIAHPESHVSVSDEGTSDVSGTDLVAKLEQGDMGDTQLPIIECAQPSFQEVRIASAVVKRRSVKIAGLPSTSDASCDDESTESTKYPRTPRFSRRKSTRTSIAHPESHVSVSDEGTSDVTGGTDFVPKLEQGDMGDTQLPIIECAQPSLQEVRIASAVDKRRSVKFAGLLSTSDASCDDESTESTKCPRTPRFSRRKSTRTSIAHPESHVSVSDEGTSDVTSTDLVPKLEQGDMGDTQLPIIECAQPSFQEVRIASAVAKRRSVKIAGLPSTSDDENTENTRYPRTPRFSRRKSTRTSIAHPESQVSTFVSVSDEGTSDEIGGSVVDEMKLPATPRHGLLFTSPGKSSTRRRKRLTSSEVIDVSGEGTALSANAGAVYQVGKPEASCRVLQELSVKKFDGEVSFIEVPVDEDAEFNVSVEHTPPAKKLMISDAQVIADVNSSTAVSEGDSQSTQPFTPRVSTSTTASSSAENTASPGTPLARSSTPLNTPRSSRSRGLSMAAFSSFKTPAEPVSAALTKSQRKRRKTLHDKSPEEMIEILKKSPMIEMTRRRSRHVSSPGLMNPTNLDALLAAQTTNVEEAIEVLPQAQTIEQVQENGGIKYFRELLVSETNRLNQLCNQWNEVTIPTVDLSEEVQGQIRSAVGKAQLLIAQRFKQFSGLVDDCEFNRGEKETTLTDLQGFWEMIYFQVENVNQLFVSLTELRQRNWQIKQASPTKNVPKRQAMKIKKPTIKSNFAAFRNEVLRRKEQAAAVQPSDASVTKTFDAGHFQVKSPVRSPSAEKSHEQSNSTSQEVIIPVVEKPANDEQSSTPVSQGNKENVSHIGHRLMSMSAKRLSYLPVVPSPLLNDITDLRPTK